MLISKHTSADQRLCRGVPKFLKLEIADEDKLSHEPLSYTDIHLLYPNKFIVHRPIRSIAAITNV